MIASVDRQPTSSVRRSHAGGMTSRTRGGAFWLPARNDDSASMFIPAFRPSPSPQRRRPPLRTALEVSVGRLAGLLQVLRPGRPGCAGGIRTRDLRVMRPNAQGCTQRGIDGSGSRTSRSTESQCARGTPTRCRGWGARALADTLLTLAPACLHSASGPERRNPRACEGLLECRRRDSNPRHADYDSYEADSRKRCKFI